MKISERLYPVICILLLSSLLFSYKLNSVCIIALLLVWIIEGGFTAKFRQLFREPFFLLSLLLFGLYLLGIPLSENKASARFFVEKNLSLIVLPMILLSRQRSGKEQLFVIGKVFIGGTVLLMTTASAMAMLHFFRQHQVEVFFYHKLSETVGISAIVASLFCILSLVWLLYLPPARWSLSVGGMLTAWLLLLTSKLFIAALLLILALNLLQKLQSRARLVAAGAVVALLVIIGATPNPVRQRFADMGKFRQYYLSAPDFNEGIYFDGLSLRLVFLRFGLEIVQERDASWLGAGTGDAETLLQEKIKAYHMYQGDGAEDKEGYLQFGYHNEFLQKYVQMGIAGLSVFLALLAYAWYIAIRYRHSLLRNVLLVFTLTFFTDTLLEQQVGIVPFLTYCCWAIAAIRAQQEAAKAGNN